MAAQSPEVSELFTYLRRDDAVPVVVTGTRGSGKTSLLQALQGAFERAKLPHVHHSTETKFDDSRDSTVVEQLSRQGAMALARHNLPYRRVPQRAQSGGPALPRFEMASGTLFMILDGLDYITSTQYLDASFIPMNLPKNTRLVVSATHGKLADALAARGYHVHEMAPLGDKAKRKVIGGIFENEQPKPDLVDNLVAWPGSQHPTQLRLAAQFAKLTGQAPASQQDLGVVIDYLIQHSSLTPDDVATLAVCQHGSPRDRWVDAFRLEAARSLVVLRGDLFQPAMPEVQAAMRARCKETELRLARIALAKRLQNVYSSSVLEEAVQLFLDAGAHQELADMLSTFEVFQLLMLRESGVVSRYWKTIGTANISQRYESLWKAKEGTLDAEGRTALLNNIGLLMGDCGLADAAERFLRLSVTEARKGLSPKEQNLMTGILNLALRLAKKPESYQEAETLFRELLDLTSDVAQDLPVQRYTVLSNLGDLYESMNRYDEALACHEQTVEVARALLGNSHPIVGYRLLDLSLATYWYKPASSLAAAEQAHAILLAALGEEHFNVQLALRRIAIAQLMLGRRAEAMENLHRAVALARPNSKRFPGVTARALIDLSTAAEAEGDWEASLRYQDERITVLRTTIGENHADTINAERGQALRFQVSGQLERGLEAMEACIRKQRGIASDLPPDRESLASSMVTLAGMRLASGNRQGCEDLLEEVNAFPSETGKPFYVARTCLLRSELARRDGLRDQQCALLREAIADVKPGKVNHHFLGTLHVVLGGALLVVGDTEASRSHHEAGIQHQYDWQDDWREAMVSSYEALFRGRGSHATLAEERLREIDTMLKLHIDQTPLGLAIVPSGAVRVAWNPVNPQLLALLSLRGTSQVLAWHPSAGALEVIESPFDAVPMPPDQSTVSLNWSASGEALRLRIGDQEHLRGNHGPDATWAPASAISPDGDHVVIIRQTSIRIAKSG